MAESERDCAKDRYSFPSNDEAIMSGSAVESFAPFITRDFAQILKRPKKVEIVADSAA